MEGTNRGIPMTRRIAAEMEERIADGTLPAGSRLPSVRELAVRYGISTAVCLSAYRALEKKGLVERRAGSGTFVCGTPAAADPKNYFYSWDCVLPSMEAARLAASLSPELEFSAFPASTYDYNPDYLDWIISRNSGGESHPGLIVLDEGQLPVLASEKVLLPLDDLLDGSDFPVRDGFPPELLRSLSFGGKLYALPLAFNPVFLCYNRRVFRRRGVAEPDGSWNWDDLLRHAELLTDAGPEGVSCYGLAILFTPNSYVPFVFQNDGEFFDRNGNCVIDSEPAFEALSFFSELYRLPGVCSHRHGDPRSALADLMSNDFAAMLIGDGIDYAMLCERMPPDDWGMVKLPAGKRSATSLSVWGIGLSAGPRAQERFALLERCFRPGHWVDCCRSVNTLPAYEPAANHVPPLITELLREAYPSIQSTSRHAVNAVSETIQLLLAHKLRLTREQCREFCRKINARL